MKLKLQGLFVGNVLETQSLRLRKMPYSPLEPKGSTVSRRGRFTEWLNEDPHVTAKFYHSLKSPGTVFKTDSDVEDK